MRPKINANGFSEKENPPDLQCSEQDLCVVKVAYWISSNIAIAILNLSLLLPLVIALPTLR